MNRQALVASIREKKSYLCVGLDTDPEKIPSHLSKDTEGMFAFNKAIIDATRPYAVAYKVNTAFYEALGSKGWELLERTADYIGAGHFGIADAKRGDIGNTSDQYAKAFFRTLPFDAVTVAPYMGEDSVRSFLNYEDKWAIVLGLTSNPGALDFEMQTMLQRTEGFDDEVHVIHEDHRFLFEMVLDKCVQWGSDDKLMFVVGATRPEQLAMIRHNHPEYFFLVPGVGAQGGSLQEVSRAGLMHDGGLLVNASRAIIYASSKTDFAEKAAETAKQYQLEMAMLLAEKGI